VVAWSFHLMPGNWERTATTISQHDVSSTRSKEGESRTHLSRENQLTKESLRSTVQKFCRIRVFCSDREPPGDVDVVPVHGRR
jgi:hypothetical protein